MCNTLMGRPLSFSPPPFPPEEVHGSPEYAPVSALWTKVADLNEEAAALGFNNVIHFGPANQLTQEVGGRTMTAAVTEQVAGMILDERRSNIVDSIFVPCQQPILQEPEVVQARGTAREGRTPRKNEPRRSNRQKAQSCSVPVSKRATHRLIKAFELAGPLEPVGEQAMQAFVTSFDAPMTEKRIKAVRMLASLDSGPAMAASAQLAAVHDMAATEEVAV